MSLNKINKLDIYGNRNLRFSDRHVCFCMTGISYFSLYETVSFVLFCWVYHLEISYRITLAALSSREN